MPQARPGSTFASPCGLKGSHFCLRSIRYSSTIDATEQKRGGGVFRPGHFVLFMHAGHAINQSLDGPQRKIKERLFTVEHPGHEYTNGLGERENDEEKNSDLQPAVCGHGSEFLRLEQSRKQIAQQQHTHNNQQGVFNHGRASPELFASPKIGNRDSKEGQRREYKDQVCHANSSRNISRELKA